MNEQMMAHLPKWIQEIAERESKATKGPWVVKHSLVFGDAWDLVQDLAESQEYAILAECFPNKNDANLCAHARTDVPRLIELVAEMAELLERLMPELMPEECYGGEAEDAACCSTCQICDYCERYEVLRVLAKWRGEASNND